MCKAQKAYLHGCARSNQIGRNQRANDTWKESALIAANPVRKKEDSQTPDVVMARWQRSKLGGLPDVGQTYSGALPPSYPLWGGLVLSSSFVRDHRNKYFSSKKNLLFYSSAELVTSFGEIQLAFCHQAADPCCACVSG